MRIEQTKGGLLEGSYKWILDNSDFQRWRDDEQSRLFWIKGDAGKGKAMLLIGIINELTELTANTGLLSFFFCQGTDSRLNNATALLRGLIYLLLIKQERLISHLRTKYDHAGKELFEDTNAFYEIFRNMLQDPRLTTTYLIIDALDECETGLPQLLELITKTTVASSTGVKWIVSSRNRPDIDQRLALGDARARLSLELNAKHVSHAIGVYIDHKVSQITSIEREKVPKDQVRDKMRQKAGGTFL